MSSGDPYSDTPWHMERHCEKRRRKSDNHECGWRIVGPRMRGRYFLDAKDAELIGSLPELVVALIQIITRPAKEEEALRNRGREILGRAGIKI